ncbi:hypothetical protein Pmani_033625 [Petrolisthes manimaculis]|uniref:G-protein coupled receptors family 1 profile domain-containing protein n=1 Tax=Petrolisthes manimaculis TaxID=1843537 RepID=A0AAE1NR68_9EUCA|nr:hypothetical protein Pmani_033625 [Petrolisthes manimaculis]
MTPVRAKVLIGLVWVISFLICLPPLVGWTDKEDTQTVTVEQDCTRTCKLNDNTGYVIYSACGSFFVPMLVMLFFYWKIYCAAAETTRAINQGFRTTKNKKILGSRFQEERLTLRIHRGRNSMQEHNQNNTQKQQNSHGNQRRYNTQRNGHRNNGPQGRSSSMKMKTLRPQLIMKTSISSSLQPDLNHLSMSDRCDLCQAQCSQNHSPELLSPPPCSSGNGNGGFSNKPNESCFTVNTNFSDKASHKNQLSVELTPPTPSRCSSAPSSSHLPRRFAGTNGGGAEAETGGGGGGGGAGEGSGGGRGGGSGEGGGGASASSKSNTHLKPIRGRTNTTSRMGRRNIKLQVKRFRMETKAAKTLGIIVGVFILCWLPFFTMYLIRGICSQCVIWDLLFDILFWLGYCNSAVNPFIYALFSKDFRYAFKTILCKCVCRRERRLGMPHHQQSIYIPSFDRDNDSDDEDSKR